MKIHLLTYTKDPLKAIGIPMANMGIGKKDGKNVTNLDEISKEEAVEYFQEVVKSYLPEPLTFASFNFFFQDIPIWFRAQLVRSHIGWSYAERSLRFFDVNTQRKIIEDYDWDAMPDIDRLSKNEAPFFGTNLKEVMKMEMKRQLEMHHLLLGEDLPAQDARNVIPTWYPTQVQTTATYMALRHLLSKRLVSQAHPLWFKAAAEIKRLITEVSPELGAELKDACEINGKCVWGSKLDRDCLGCIERGWRKSHEHIWSRTTSFGEKTQCDCGIMKPMNLIENRKGN